MSSQTQPPAGSPPPQASPASVAATAPATHQPVRRLVEVRPGTRPITTPAGHWLSTVRRRLLISDILAVGAATTVAAFLRFREAFLQPPLTGYDVAYIGFWLLLSVLWLTVLAGFNTRDPRVLGFGADEYGRLVKATLWLFGAIALVSYLGKLEVARGYLLLAFPLGLVLLMYGRKKVRDWLNARRSAGELLHRVVIISGTAGDPRLLSELNTTPTAGFDVIDTIVLGDPAAVDPAGRTEVSPGDVRAGDARMNAVHAIVPRARALGADTIIIGASARLAPEELRQVGWALEGLDVDLIVAPSVTEIAGPRLRVHTVEGLPLLHLEQPQFSGPARVLKRVFDITGSLVALIVLSPLLAVIALAVRVSSPGPVVYRQTRLGQGGTHFTCFKFRTMVVHADRVDPRTLAPQGFEARLFKLPRDPRVTPIGRFLRRFSLDELPQFLNVLRGEMSLVGPRPPLEREVARYEEHEHRRLLVKPGLTGLWQISGRSNLSWEDTVRLDLYYVENWSLTLDLLILARTVAVVARGEGAY